MDRVKNFAANALRVAMTYTSNTKYSDNNLSVDIEYSSPRIPVLSRYLIQLVKLCYNRKGSMEIFARDGEEHIQVYLPDAKISVYTGESVEKRNPVKVPKNYLDKYRTIIRTFKLKPIQIRFIGDEPEILIYLRGNPEPGIEVSMRISRYIRSRKRRPRKDRFGELVRWIANNTTDRNRWFRTNLGSRPILYLNKYTRLSYEPIRPVDSILSVPLLRLGIWKVLKLRTEERELLKRIIKFGFLLRSFSIESEEYKFDFKSLNKDLRVEMMRRYSL